MARKVLLLHEPGATPPELDALAADMTALGGEITLRPCAEPYDAVLDAVAAADAVLFWS